MFRSSVFKWTAVLLGGGALFLYTARYLKRRRRRPSNGESASYAYGFIADATESVRGSQSRPEVCVTDSSDETSSAQLTWKTPSPPGSPVSQHSSYHDAAEEGMFVQAVDNTRSTGSPQPDLEQGFLTVADGYASSSNESLSLDSAIDSVDREKIVEALLHKGIEEFETAFLNWSDALELASEQTETESVSSHAESTSSLPEAEKVLKTLLQSAHKLRKLIDKHQLKANLPEAVAMEPILTWIDDKELVTETDEDESASDSDSFVSAAETAAETAQLEYDDVMEYSLISQSHQLQVFRETVLKIAGDYSHLEFYVTGLEQYTRYTIPCRKLRTQLLHCENDMEFLAKLHCVREACKTAFESDEIKNWFMDTGYRFLMILLLRADKAVEDFEAAFEELKDFISSTDNWSRIEQELRSRNVRCMTFYDIVLDFVIMDAFGDLENAPYTLTKAIENKWLSSYLKQNALTTAIWGVIKAKSAKLQDPYGFMAHFYVVNQYITPVLAWGFLGPDGDLKTICQNFKSECLGFIRDVFSFEQADYSTVHTLAADIVKLAKSRAQAIDAFLDTPVEILSN